MENIIEVKNLKKYFDVPRGTLHAVDNISFSMKEGDTLGVVGESGCGKSTMGRVLMNLLPSTDGEVLFYGKKINGLKGKELLALRSQMQMIFQDPYSSLNPRMTVSQTIEEPLITCHIEPDKEKRKAIVKDMMDTVGLSRRYENAYPHEMDGGRRQRVGIARALVLNPRFVVCDEPVSALDVSIQAQILNLLQDIQKERNLNYLFITHNLSVVKHISNEIMVMYLGQAVEKCSSKELFLHPLHPYTKALLSAIPVPTPGYKRERILLKGELSSPINPKNECRFAKRCNYACEACFQSAPVQEEVLPGHFVSCHRVREINQI